MWAADFAPHHLGNYTLFDDHRANLGHTAVGTPGVVAGLASLHSRARLPWAALIEPAAVLARTGFPAPEFAFEYVQRLQPLGMPSGEQRMTYTSDSAHLWCREDGSIKRPGDHWSNPALADTLERLARSGARDFYEGEPRRAYRRRAHEGRRVRYPRRSAALQRATVRPDPRHLPRLASRQRRSASQRHHLRANAAGARPLRAAGARIRGIACPAFAGAMHEAFERAFGR